VSFSHLHYLAGQTLAATAENGNEVTTLAMVTTVILSFLLVFWVLKKFAFAPLLSVIDERREKIENDLQRAEQIRAEAAAEKAELDERLQNIENEARQKMNELVNEGKRISASIQDEARKQADDMIEKAKTNIQLETEKARETLKAEVIDLTIRATERMIRDSLDETKHRNLINDFIEQIERN
jgi:F-type H+-transporting ATPase subunit b